MNRAELVKTLELIEPALAKTNMVPIFQCFTFENSYVSAYNDSVAIIGPTECEEAFGINGKILLGLLSNSKAEEVTISLDKSTATLKLGKTISKLPYDPKDNFIFTEPEDKWIAELQLTSSFFEALNLCLETVADDQTQAALLGITIQGDKMYSCDGDAVTRVQLNKGIGKNRILLSTVFCEAIAKLWTEKTMTRGILLFNSEWVSANFEDWTVYGRILEIKTPIDFENELKKTIKQKIELQPVPEGFNDALSRALVLSAAESQKTVITVEKSKMNLFTETYMGEISDTLAFKNHPDARVNVNAAHLQRATKHCDQVAFHENGTLFEKTDVMILVSNM